MSAKAERVFVYRKVDLKTGLPEEILQVGFSSIPKNMFEWREVGCLSPGENGRYRYEQSSNWPYPQIDAYILRTIADRIDTLNRRATLQKEAVFLTP